VTDYTTSVPFSSLTHTISDYLAASVDAFLTSHPAEEFNANSGSTDAIHLGLTFSFPVEQTALDSGKILTWTKGFSAKNAIGHDVVKLLQDAFDRKHMHVKCVALVNDVSEISCYLFNADNHIIDRRRTALSSIYCWRLHSWQYIWHGHQRSIH
jgi:hexokinase